MLAMSLCGSPAGSSQRRRLKTSVLDQDRSDGCGGGGCGSEADCEERWAAINKQTFQEILNAILSQTILISSSPATKPHLQLINQISVCSASSPSSHRTPPPLFPDSRMTSRDANTVNVSFCSFNFEKPKPLKTPPPTTTTTLQLDASDDAAKICSSIQVPHIQPLVLATESQRIKAEPVEKECDNAVAKVAEKATADSDRRCTSSTSIENQMKAASSSNEKVEARRFIKDHSILNILGRKSVDNSSTAIIETKKSSRCNDGSGGGRKHSKNDTGSSSSRWLAVDKSVLNKLVESILSEPVKSEEEIDDADSPHPAFSYLPMYLPNFPNIYRPLAFNPWQLYPINLMSFSATLPTRMRPLVSGKEPATAAHRNSPRSAAIDRASVVVENSSVLRSLLDADDEEILGKAHAEATPLSPPVSYKPAPKQRPEIRRRRRNKLPSRLGKSSNPTSDVAGGGGQAGSSSSYLKWKSTMLRRVNSDGSE